MADGKKGPSEITFYVDGYDVLANKVTNLRHKITAPTITTTGLGDTFESLAPTGVKRLEIVQEGAFFDTTATTGGHVAFAAKEPTTPQSSVRVCTLGFASDTIGDEFYGISGAFSNTYEVVSENSQLQKANVEYVVTGAGDANGIILQHTAAKTADWNTRSSSVDNAASSASGGSGYLVCTAASGFSAFVGTIEHSADNSTFASLIAFTDNVTDPYAERKTVSGTVNRYLAFAGNVTGSGSITVFAGFSRS